MVMTLTFDRLASKLHSQLYTSWGIFCQFFNDFPVCVGQVDRPACHNAPLWGEAW